MSSDEFLHFNIEDNYIYVTKCFLFGNKSNADFFIATYFPCITQTCTLERHNRYNGFYIVSHRSGIRTHWKFVSRFTRSMQRYSSFEDFHEGIFYANVHAKRSSLSRDVKYIRDFIFENVLLFNQTVFVVYTAQNTSDLN